MVLNSKGEKSADNTQMTIWEHSNVPINAQITFTAATAAAQTTTAKFTLANKTEKRMVDLYIADSAATAYGDDFLTKNNYTGFAPDKVINDVSFEFDANTKYDFYIRYEDGSEAEALDLSFAKATSTGGKITINASSVVLTNSSGTTLSSVELTKKTAMTETPVVTDKTVTIYNMTGKTWTGLFSSSVLVDDWGDNLSSGDVADKTSLKVIFPVSKDEYKFDLSATYSNGEYRFVGLDLSSVSSGATFYLYLDGTVPTISSTKPAEAVPVVTDKTITIYNMTGKTWTGLFSSSVLVDDWGDNLSSGDVADKTSLKVIFPVSKDEYKFDLSATYSNGEYRFVGLDLSSFSSGATFYLYLDGTVPTISSTKPAVEDQVTVKKITFKNNSNRDFSAVYYVQSGSDWGDSVCELKNKESVVLDFTLTASHHLFDIKCVSDSTEFVYRNIDFSAIADGSKLFFIIANGEPDLRNAANKSILP